MLGHLFAVGPVAVAQPAGYVFARLGQKRQNRLITLLAFVLGVVALAASHLLAIQRVHGRVRVQRGHRQAHIRRRPNPFPHLLLHAQDLHGYVQVQSRQETPQRGLGRQAAHFQDARQQGVLRDEAELIQAREPHVDAEHHAQHELVPAHGPGHALHRDGLFHQRLEAEFLQHGGDRQQAAVGRQVLTAKIIWRGSPDSIGLGRDLFRALIGGRFSAKLPSAPPRVIS